MFSGGYLPNNGETFFIKLRLGDIYLTQTANCFPQLSKSRSENVLYLIHIPYTNEDKRTFYFATFIDDKLRWTQIYFMKVKSEVKKILSLSRD